MQRLQEVVQETKASRKPERLDLCIELFAVVDSGRPSIEHIGGVGIEDTVMGTFTSMDRRTCLRCRQVRTPDTWRCPHGGRSQSASA